MIGRTRCQLIAFAIGLALIFTGAPIIDISSLSRIDLGTSEGASQWSLQPERQKFKPPITIELDLWYANGTGLKARLVIPRYTGDGGPVYGQDATKAIRLDSGTQLLWGGWVYDVVGVPMASASIGLFYFPVRAGCDETRIPPASCFTPPTLVYRTKTDNEGRFGHDSKLQPQSRMFYSWSVPQLSAGDKDIIVYADFPNPPIFEQRVKRHYAIGLAGQSVIVSLSINGQTIIETGGEVKDRVGVSSPVTIRIRTRASSQMTLFVVVGRCGDGGCLGTPPPKMMLMQELIVDARTREVSFTWKCYPAQYMFYVLRDRVDPFAEGSALQASSVLVFGIMDTSPQIEYRLFGIVLLIGGMSLVLSGVYRLLVIATNLLARLLSPGPSLKHLLFFGVRIDAD